MFDWKEIDLVEDKEITYKLYQEGLTIPQIARIRNIDTSKVNQDIIELKHKIRENKTSKNISNDKGPLKDQDQKSLKINDYLAKTKDERLEIIQNLLEANNEQNLLNFKQDIYKRLISEENAEDLIILIWTCGELKDPRFLFSLHSMTYKNHGGIRRYAYSALGKIASEKSLKFLYRGLKDDMPQARQYAATAIGKIGNQESIPYLENARQKENSRGKDTKTYVIRAIESSIERIREQI